MQPLPIDSLLPGIVDALRKNSSLILQAEPGAGKTTRVPAALLKAGLTDREIWVLQPRRLATRLAARRVAEELGVRLGSTVGYQIRFDEVSSPQTRLRFVTEGILTRKLLSEPDIPSIGIVILDEFHERHLAGDISLALLKRAQAQRAELKIVVMSATLDVVSLATYLNDCPIVHATGRLFEVVLEYLPASDKRTLDQQVLAGLKRLFSRAGVVSTTGHILVFLPGAHEIRRAADTCRDFAKDHQLVVCPLYADLPPEEQDRVVQPSTHRKLILATNVAETSLTIEGVSAVIDSGLARTATHSPWSGLPTLKVAPISKSSATQRMGRAGRTRNGTCLRLYTQHDFDNRAEHQTPEIQRLDMTETVLQVRALGFTRVEDFPFFEPPLPAAVESAELLLRRLSALTGEGTLTEIGRQLLLLPVHPRLGRIMVEAATKRVTQDGARLAAILSEREVRNSSADRSNSGGLLSGRSDLLELLETGRLSPTVERSARQLTGMLDASKSPPGTAPARFSPAWENALLYCVLAGFPDRVSKRKRHHGSEVLLSGGGTAQLADSSVVRESQFLVAVDVDDRAQFNRSQPLIRSASHVEPEWLIEVSPGDLVENDVLAWNAIAQRVDRTTRLAYGNLTLDETRTVAPDSPAARRVAADALSNQVNLWRDEAPLRTLESKCKTFARAFPDDPLPALSEMTLQDLASQIFFEQGSLVGIDSSELALAWVNRLPADLGRRFLRAVPEKLPLAFGRTCNVAYFTDQPPRIEAKIQEFFGMKQAPQLAGGRIPLTLHLLAPNQRPVQVTSDLIGFWERHYPSIRKELSRRYPRHFWPEDPLTAKPPPPRR